MEILFRGKRIDTGEWVYGFYGHKPNGNEVEGHFIIKWCFNVDSDSIYAYFSGVPVIPETVGQYTGLDDKNGVKIFKGDVVRYLNSIESGTGVVTFDTCAYQFNWIDIDEANSLLMYFQCSEEMEVIGNIHDNPELMEDNTNDN